MTTDHTQLPVRPQLQLADLPDPGEEPPPWRIRYTPGHDYSSCITIPRPMRNEDGNDRRDDRGIGLSGAMAARLAQDGPEIAHAYLLLSAWEALGETISIERYLMETWGTVDMERVWPLVALHKRGLLMSPVVSDERARDFVEVRYGSRWLPEDGRTRAVPPNQIVAQTRRAVARMPKKSHQVPPDPWPSYTGDRWSGDSIESARKLGRTDVVYCLYDADDTLIYIGSTGHLRARLRGHNEKPWVRYIAHGCHSRSDADWLEAAAIRADRPPLNRDTWCAGKADVVPAKHVVSAGCVTR